MARPRSNKLKNKGRGTTFGKQSDAEKSFRKRPRRTQMDNPNRSSGPDKGTFRPRSSRFGDKTEGRRPPSSEAGSYRKKSGNFRQDKPDFRERKGPSSRPHSDREEKPFRKPGSKSFQPRKEGPPRFSKSSPPRFGEGDRNEKPFAKGRGKSFPPRREDSGFSKRPYRSAPSGPPRRDETERESRPEREPRPERKSFIQSRVVRSGDFTKTIRGESPKPKEPTRSNEATKSGEPARKDEGLTRLNKFIANSGVGSRREADELIKMGLIKVNGVTITELGTKVKPGDEVRYEDRVLKAESLVYILLNKPKGFITTTEDPQERNTVMGIVAGACKERIYPVGRLDRNTTGLLLLTNDGDLADKLTHPSYKAKKVYKVELDRPLTKADYQKVMEGVQLEEGRAMVDDCAIISDDNKTVGLEIHIGWNRVVRRIFESLGYEVSKLDRSVFAGLDKKDLSRGQWRFLKPEEIVRLKHFK